MMLYIVADYNEEVRVAASHHRSVGDNKRVHGRNFLAVPFILSHFSYFVAK